MSTTGTQRTRTILEAGYKIVPGKEAGFFEYYKEFVPIAMKQDGFESVFGGPILDSTWLSFRVNFESAEQMDAWHRNPTHQAVQRSAYERWWTAPYLRKWREAAPGEVLQGRVMCEARLLREAKLNAAEIQLLREALAGIAEAGAEPFETLTGDFEPQPYQFAGPVQGAGAHSLSAGSGHRR